MRRSHLVAVFVALLALAGLPGTFAVEAADPPSAAIDPLLEQALDRAGPADEIVAIANLDAPASPSDVAALEATGALVHPYRHLPMAGVVGTAEVIRSVAAEPVVRSLYWNEPQQPHLKESQEAIGASEVWDLGLHGEGVGIAILDTGIDASHPDLSDHVVQNVKVLGPGYVGMAHGTFDAIYVEDVENSDSTSGHGTHVAGDAAGDGTASGGKLRGPAYEADVIGLGTGEGLNIFTALAGFDWVIENQEAYNIRVVNNSWGTSFRLHDPEHPVVRASELVTGAGVLVVFAAGNSYEEMTLSPYAAPWNVTVAAGAEAGGLTGFSSKGIEFDNLGTIESPDQVDFFSDSAPVDGVGLYHPSVTGIGEDVASARAPATVVSALGFASGDENLEPTEVPYYTHASGTSMSAPQVSGLAAIAQQAFHEGDDTGRWLTPAQLKSVLQISAAPMPGLKLWQQGYGLIDAPAAASLAASLADLSDSDIDAVLADGMADRNLTAASEQAADIIHSYAWRRPTLDSAFDLQSYELPLEVPTEATRVKAIALFPETPLLNVAELDMYLYDADGTEVASATGFEFTVGIQKLDVEFADLDFVPTPGTWTLEVTGFLSSSCWSPGTDCFGILDDPAETWVTAAVLTGATDTGPIFDPTGSLTLYLHNESEGETPPPVLVKPGYKWDGTGPAGGDLSTADPDNPRAGFAGYTHSHAPVVADPAVFVTAPLAEAVIIGDNLGIDVWLQSEPGLVGRGSISYAIAEVTSDGEATVIWSDELAELYTSGPDPVHNRFDFDLPLPHSFAAGSSIQATLQFSAGVHAALRLYYDSPAEPSALTFTTGTIS